MTEYSNFRQRLDAVLRTRNIQEVSTFLIAEGQWSPDSANDPELAMWLMIAGSPSLKDLHTEAKKWLTSRGHSEAVAAISSLDKASTNQSRGKGSRTKKAGPGPL